MKSFFTTILTVLFVAVIIAGAAMFDFWIWRLQHPQAPGWTFMFGH